MDAIEWIIIIIIVIIAVAIFIWAIWFFFVRKVGLPAGSDCTKQDECEKGTFCNGNGKCSVGSPVATGKTCVDIERCVIGQVCLKPSSSGLKTCQIPQQ